MTAGGVIVASPVRQSPDVLREFLRSLAHVERVWLFDDTDNLVSRQMLAESGAERVLSLSLEPALSVPYRRLSTTHLWTPATYHRVGEIKDYLIGEFLQTDAEWLFLVDSDVLIPPGLVEHLIGLDLPVVSEVFWTHWQSETPRLPQVWFVHPGGFENADQILALREPGVYSVSGLGACTLLHRDALTRGLRFAPVPGLQYQGEDRHFCIRANVLGVPLYVDTQMPAYHVYREDDLAGGRAWLDDGCPPETIRGWLDDDWAIAVNRWFGATHATGIDPRMYLGCTEPWVTDLLVALCRAIGAKRALEIGVYTAKTTAPLAVAVDELVAIDREIRAPAVNAVAQYKNVRLVEGNAVGIIPTLGGQFDFVYVDAGHDYESVKTQTEAVWPLIRSGGVVAFHDVLAADDDGVRRYLSERFPHALILDTRSFPWARTGLALVAKE